MTLQSVILTSAHHKKAFSCGKTSLDDYIQKQAGQDQKKKIAVCFVLAESDGTIKGYYTLANDSIKKELIPEEMRKTMPYRNLPVTLLGRLARDEKYKGQGIGEWLLLDALRRGFDVSRSIGSIAIVVDPIDQQAREFYLKFGFIDLPDCNRMFLPMETVRQLFG